jgi:hypothetical protein
LTALAIDGLRTNGVTKKGKEFNKLGCIGFLVYRFNAVFNVSKTRAAVVAVLCFLGSIPFFLMGSAFAMLGLTALAYSCIYGCIWLYKYSRDRKIVESAQVVAQQAPVGPVIEMCNPRSNGRYFVPPPLDRA